ncbi:metallophosphoesterase [Polaribacter reichenbachii]|uniref:Metallophosphoesterase n=1 Tax=Polaribacter reichenbachii TaxID=996801 RepID=A0A1B8U044_9FLAO|nr:metallophosphoesterase family protein [Polaribacter reichenbachii]APZ47101.1 metallophosphoesterase [Polaribacter reichenbachii]AUC17742.1 metallophosphoesterase [Polaribacter reichenbachii]OBY65235.1 metallophosphoesterase [Polaribacter reichenbachii]
MKKTVFVLLGLIVLTACKTKEKESHHHDNEHHLTHSHKSYKSDVDAHKLIYPSKAPDRIIVSLTEDAKHSFAVNWRTSQQIETAFVEVAEETHGPDFLLDEKKKQFTAKTELITVENTRDKEPSVNAAYHSAIINNLKPGTDYVYRVGDGSKNRDTWSEWFQISTPSTNENESFSFIYFGDAQNDVKSMWSRVIRKSYKMMPEVDFMLHAGDLINHSESDREWGEWFYAGSFIHATVPSIMTPGNHEYDKSVHRTKLSALWRPQFTLPENGPLDELKETCYALDYQNMKVISIDAQSFNNSKHSREAQTKWLDSVLVNNTKKWVTITMHYPIFSTAKGRDNQALRENLKPLIDKYNVDLVLQGHDHTYARGYASNEGLGRTIVQDAGTVYAVSVSGPKMYESQNQDWMVKRGEYVQLFQIITVENDRIEYNSYTTKGEVYDSFSLMKNKNGKKTLTNNKSEVQMRLKKDFVKK